MDLFESKRLREERQPIAVKIKELAEKVNSENRDFTGEERGEWEKLNKAYDEFGPKIESAERRERLELFEGEATRSQATEQPPGRENYDGREERDRQERERQERETAQQKPTPKDHDIAFRAWAMRQSGLDLNEEQIAACRRSGHSPTSRDFVVNLRGDYNAYRQEMRALSSQLDTAGGYLVPDGFVPSLERALLFFGGIRSVATIRRTATGEDLQQPMYNDTGNTGQILAENATVSETDPSFQAMTLHAYEYTSNMVRVPVRLMQDSAFDLASELGTMLGERLGRIQNTHCTTGTGGGQPRGLATAANTGVTAAGTASITADELFDLEHSLDIAYRNMGPSWMTRDTTLREIRQLKDGNGQYLWQPGLQTGTPDRLLGYPVVINNDVAALASAATTFLFGVFSKYILREVNQIVVRRLVERYADSNQEAFVAFMRFDGNLLNAGGNPVQRLVQA